MSRTPPLALLTAGATAALGSRVLLHRLLLGKFRRDVRALNAGDHRWSGEHRGRAAIDRFLRNFVGAGLQGEIRELFVAGPPWRLTVIARFDDRATGPDGDELYANRVILLVRTRWRRIVHHEDFYEDTGRILALERRLRELGVEPAD